MRRRLFRRPMACSLSRAEPEPFYDNSLIKELDDSGFIGALFGKR